MKDEVQHAGDHATQINASTVSNTQINVNITDANGLVAFLREAVGGATAAGGSDNSKVVEQARRAARDEFNSRLAELHERENNVDLQDFASLPALNAVEQGQNAYVNSGCDPLLAEDLCKLILEIVRAQTGSLRDRILRSAMDALPKLTARQIDLLATIHILRQVIFTGQPGDPIAIINRIATELIPLATDTGSWIDYQYMASCGLGTISDLGMGGDAFDAVRTSHSYSLQRGFPADDLAVEPYHLVDIGNNSFILSRESVAISKDPTSELASSLSKALDKTLLSSAEIIEAFAQESIQLCETLKAMEKFGAFEFRLTAVGSAIGNLRWHSLSENALSFDLIIAH